MLYREKRVNRKLKKKKNQILLAIQEKTRAKHHTHIFCAGVFKNPCPYFKTCLAFISKKASVSQSLTASLMVAFFCFMLPNQNTDHMQNHKKLEKKITYE